MKKKQKKQQDFRQDIQKQEMKPIWHCFQNGLAPIENGVIRANQSQSSQITFANVRINNLVICFWLMYSFRMGRLSFE
jgi:hypothetical protein